MSGVQFGNQIDMNGNKITELAPGVAGTDAVNVSQLSAFADGFAATIGDGVASTFNINHALALTNKNDFVMRVAEVTSGQEYSVDVVGIDLNNASVTFGFIPTAGQFRVAVAPVR
jgi:hypothetical protein